MDATTGSSSSKWLRRARNGAVLLALLAALYALLGFLILPLLVKPRLEALATEQLARRATLGRLEFNPFTLRARLIDFALTDRDPQRPFVRFATLDLDVSLASLWHLAPVLDAVRLVRPQIDLTRNADGTSSIDDLIAKATSGPPGPATPFSLNNIEVDDGSVSLDDRPHERRIVVSSIGIGIPFLSSLPHDAEIRVTPRLEGAVDGARFGLRGSSTSPFAETREATLEWNLDALPLARYAQYLSLPGGMRLTDGALTTRLKLAFVTEKGVARTIVLSGTAHADNFALARKEGTPLASAKSIDVTLAKLDWLARSIALDRVLVDAPRGDLRRDRDGTLEFARLFEGEAQRPQPRQSPKEPARPWSFSVAEVRVSDGTVRVADGSVTPAFEVVLSKLGVEGRRIASTGGAGSIEARFDVDDGAGFELQGELDLAGRQARGHFACRTFHLAKLYPYYASVLNLDVRRGTLDLAGDFEAKQDVAAPRFTLTKGVAVLSDIETAVRGEKDPLWRVARGDIDGVAFDLAGRSATIDRVSLQQGSISVVREADGAVNFERLVRRDAASGAEPRAAESAATPGDGWKLSIRRFELERIAGSFEDRTTATPVKLRIADARMAAENYSSVRGSRSAVELAARIGSRGRLRLDGAFAADPFAADWRIDTSGVDLVPLRPYFEARTNVVVTSGSLGAKGRLTFAAARTGTPSVSYKGDVTIGDFASLDRPASEELMRWKTLTLTGVDTTSEPLNVAIGSIGMDGFYARVILDEGATLNLKRLLAPESSAAQAASPGPKTTAAGVTTKELPPPAASQELPVSIGRIVLSNGEVQYSDFFVKPNYTAHLTDVSGSVSALSASQSGTVEVAGRVEGAAPVDIRGTLNPFAQQLQLDLTGKATDVDLPPLTPYSVKYAGYGIQKGKLSFEVHYRIDDRKLAATNKLKLDQLTFGEHVDSPTATKLPVLLAVSLLKDRNGVINLDLPIQGTLDDPKFSVWGVLVQIFVNLITKAVTAPFALLGAIAGGAGGEQLAYIEFAPGRTELSEVAQQKLATLAKALTDRPGLRIDAAGRAIPDVDRDGLKRATLERALRTQKQKTFAAAGESAPPLESLTIDAEEYPKLLTAVYRDTDLPDKPRNVLGIAKTIPPAEMEALLLASYRVDAEALATLANRRAQAVKEWFVGKGDIPAERVFVVAPKLTAEGISDKGAPTRVDFAIR
ncbi:MAG TPA: DUF748 domain-containing protein [Casimicrobiaceae bacterium]